jgi:hypothetical protein
MLYMTHAHIHVHVYTYTTAVSVDKSLLDGLAGWVQLVSVKRQAASASASGGGGGGGRGSGGGGDRDGSRGGGRGGGWVSRDIAPMRKLSLPWSQHIAYYACPGDNSSSSSSSSSSSGSSGSSNTIAGSGNTELSKYSYSCYCPPCNHCIAIDVCM